jgi:MSHA pilin protein MshA
MYLGKFENIKQVNAQSANKQKGFTLIELVVVIVILGILAVTAAPKFIDLTSDARAAVVEAVKGSINSAADMAHSKALVAGKTAAAASGQSISVGSSTIDLNYGWPTNASMADLLEFDDDIVEVSSAPGTFEHKDATNGSSCRAIYDSSSLQNAETRPDISSITETANGC